MVEIFLDKLHMNLTIDLEGALETDSLTIPLAELLLEKLQMVKMDDDIKDVIIS